MEFLDLLYPVLISIFVAISSVVFAFFLQQGEDDVIDLAFSRRVVSRTIYQLPGRVPISPLQASFLPEPLLAFPSSADPAVRQQTALLFRVLPFPSTAGSR